MQTDAILNQKVLDSKNLYDFYVNFETPEKTIENFKTSRYYRDKINVKEFLSSPPLPSGITKVSPAT